MKPIFRPNGDEIGERRRLDNEEHHSVYCLPNTVKVIKYRLLRWAGHIARMEEGSAFKISTGVRTVKKPLGSPGADGKIILEWILKK